MSCWWIIQDWYFKIKKNKNKTITAITMPDWWKVKKYVLPLIWVNWTFVCFFQYKDLYLQLQIYCRLWFYCLFFQREKLLLPCIKTQMITKGKKRKSGMCKDRQRHTDWRFLEQKRWMSWKTEETASSLFSSNFVTSCDSPISVICGHTHTRTHCVSLKALQTDREQ